MRKLKLQVQMTVDGFMAGPNGEMDWVNSNWDDNLNRYVGDLTASVDLIVLGRGLAEGFIPYWASVAADAENPEQSSGKLFTNTPKIVFTKTLEASEWQNTALAKGSLVDEIMRLKAQDGQDIIAYGGVTFVSALVKNRLVDELNLFVNPVAIGSGMPIFADLETKLALQLVESKGFECGIVLLKYKSADVE
ncbi:MAG: dihydrofolate reductase family protein [Anaerolineales bacterium]|nr:dihydrofolate reductase family protein [Anaerolineales bacterium]